MNIITDEEFARFLTSYPLYSKINAIENLKTFHSAYLYHDGFMNKSFKFLCSKENDIQTFKTNYTKDFFVPINNMLRNNENQLPYTFNKKTEKLDLVFHLNGICQSCENPISFLLHAQSDKKWSERKQGLNICIQKVGQYPPYDISLNSTLKKYLSKEDQENYKKALICLSTSYGIGAYSYLRRVIENEIKRIIQDISELTFDGSEKVKEAFVKFQEDHQMAKVIDVINKYLPSSLTEIGDNPIRLLYEQLSGGIHEFTDEECVEKAQSIDIVLNYVIKKLNEEKYQLTSVKDAMKSLRK